LLLLYFLFLLFYFDLIFKAQAKGASEKTKKKTKKQGAR